MRTRDPLRSLILVLAMCSIVVLCGCEEDDFFVTVDSENDPPLILSQGPEFPQGTVEIVGCCADDIWVLVGDPDGLDDIAAVFIDIEAVQINDVIIRPDAMSGNCASVDYTPNNTIDTTSLFALPIQIPGIHSEPLELDQGGIYRTHPFGVPSIDVVSAALGQPSGCATGGGYLDWITLNPPAVPLTLNVFVTFLDVEFRGTSVIVYDAAGDSATTTYPDLRIVYTTAEEQTIAP